MTPWETVSGVTRTANFLLVPASFKEWANTNAPANGNRVSADRQTQWLSTDQEDTYRSTEAGIVVLARHREIRNSPRRTHRRIDIFGLSDHFLLNLAQEADCKWIHWG